MSGAKVPHLKKIGGITMNYELFKNIIKHELHSQLKRNKRYKHEGKKDKNISYFRTNNDDIAICYDKETKRYTACIIGIYDLIEFKTLKELYEKLIECDITELRFHCGTTGHLIIDEKTIQENNRIWLTA
jgi:hypothetical protein